MTRGKAKRADYLLYFRPNIPLAVIEAKDNACSVGDGMQQALDYAETLKIPFAFSSNGDGFVFHDGTLTDGAIERNLELGQFPSPVALWAKYRAWKGLPAEAAVRARSCPLRCTVRSIQDVIPSGETFCMSKTAQQRE